MMEPHWTMHELRRLAQVHIWWLFLRPFTFTCIKTKLATIPGKEKEGHSGRFWFCMSPLEQHSSLIGAVHPGPACLRGVAWWWPPWLHDEGCAVVQVGEASSGPSGPGVSTASYSLGLQITTNRLQKWLQMATVSKETLGIVRLAGGENCWRAACWTLWMADAESFSCFWGIMMRILHIGKDCWPASESASVSRCFLLSSNDEFDSTKLQVSGGECTSSHKTWDGQWSTS